MKIKKMLLMLGLFGFAGASSYAMAQSYVFRYPTHGVKASSNVGSEEGSGNETGPETPESNITSPSDFYFSENNDQLSGNVGDTGTVTIYDENGTQIGQTTSDPNGDFTATFNPNLDGGKSITVEVTDGANTLTSTIIVPELETDVACYDPANIGKVGTATGCMDMLIVDNTMLEDATDTGYAITFEGVDYTFGDSEHNIFTGQVTNMYSLFISSNFNEDIGYWDTSNVVSMDRLFRNNIAFNQDIGDWDTSSVVTMLRIFENAQSFNQDISNWDISGLDSMLYMFLDATSFNQPIGNWDTSNITDMSSTFNGATNFDQYIGDWDTSNVTSMARTFLEAESFNQDISGWDTSNVDNMSLMFRDALSFNKDISGWDTSNLTDRGDMSRMFNNAQSFNQDLSNWCVTRIASSPYYFDSDATAWTLPNSRPIWGTCP